MLLTSKYWPSAITSFPLFFFLVFFFFGSVWPPVEHAYWYQLACLTKGQHRLKQRKKEKKKEDKLAFSFRQRKKLKPGFKPCFSQWAPLEYTKLDTIFSRDHNLLPPQCFSHFLSIFTIFWKSHKCTLNVYR